MSSSASQRMETNPSLELNPSPSLPDDVLLSCIARVSRLYYPTLSLVSKSFRSLLASPELYKTRSLLGRTDNCIYVCIRYGSDDYRWFTLCRKPHDTGYVLAGVPIPYSPCSPNVSFSGLVVVGFNIYNIGGSRTVRSSKVSILDCRSHTWHEAPSLPERLRELTSSVVDQKIYVAGNSTDRYSSSFHVFDINSQLWNSKPVPSFDHSKSTSIDGKFNLVINHKDVVTYNSKEGRWERAHRSMGDLMYLNCYCVIDNILYSAYQGALSWYDTTIGKWRAIYGLVGLPTFKFATSDCVRLADYGGKMAVFWVEVLWVEGLPHKNICCLVIDLERRRKSREIWGKVEWYGHLLTVPSFCDVVKALGVTV